MSYLDPIALARESDLRGSCVAFVGLWLEPLGIDGFPDRRAVLRDWRAMGVEGAVRHWCARLGFAPCDPKPYSLALIEQNNAAPIFGVLDGDMNFVARSYSKILIAKYPRLIACWHV